MTIEENGKKSGEIFISFWCLFVCLFGSINLTINGCLLCRLSREKDENFDQIRQNKTSDFVCSSSSSPSNECEDRFQSYTNACGFVVKVSHPIES